MGKSVDKLDTVMVNEYVDVAATHAVAIIVVLIDSVRRVDDVRVVLVHKPRQAIRHKRATTYRCYVVAAT